jgi:metallo-beta-lactamase family protein
LRITFHGAARQVTGSAHLLEFGDRPFRVLLDCGLFDIDRMSPDSPNRHLSFDPATLDAVVVSHAHNDHIGRLPCLVKAGYRGPFFATPATADITGVMLRDSARIQLEDSRRGSTNPYFAESRPRPDSARAGLALDTRPAEPLFELLDVERVVDALARVPYGQSHEVVPGVSLLFHDAGHILGSAQVELKYREKGRDRRLLYTGDLGRPRSGLLNDPATIRDIDILICESTYGNRDLDSYHILMRKLHAIVARATRLRSKIVIPAFSLGRTQRLVYCLLSLFATRKVKPIPIFVDSPLATRLTEIHREHREAYTPDSLRVMDREAMLFDSPFLNYCVRWEESRRIHHLDGPMVIISSAGMCEAGRIRNHLRHTVQDPDNAVVIVSYQAEGTLGRQIAEGVEAIEIKGRSYELNAAVYVLDGFSGHADRNDLAWWFGETGGNIEHAFLVHGEPEAMESLAPELQPFVRNPVILPERLESHEV